MNFLEWLVQKKINFLLKLKYSLERSLKAKSLGVNIKDHNESAISTPTIIGY